MGDLKIQQTGSHLDHMLRQTRMHHVQLSMMADVKANALMTISAVMLTFSAPSVDKEGFGPAVIVLICSTILTIVLATLAVMPKVFSGFTKKVAPRPGDSSFNLLFFGTFSAMPWTQFESEMEEMMNDSSKAYEAQVREVYVLGQYLAQKKYRLLGFAYLAFTTGLVASGALLLWNFTMAS
jgi:hypothetical protein